MATLYKWTGEVEAVTPRNKKKGFSLPELYRLLDCEMIEAVYLPGGLAMVIDEDGKFNRPQEVNREATELLKGAGGIPGDWIAGHALVCDDEEFQ